MPVSSYATDDLFTFTIKKNLLTNPADSWVNRYEAKATAAGSTDELLALAQALLLFERTLHSAAVFFSQLSVSTWEEDSVPYDPTAFISSPIAAVGLRVLAEDLIPLNGAWAVTRVCAFGRFGHLFYRGALYESEVSSPAGKAILTSPSGKATLLDDASTAAQMENYLGTTPFGGLQLVMINKDGTQVRPLVGFTTGGVSYVPTDHAWYNRTTTP